MEEFRVCSKCRIEKPLTEEFFGPQQKNKARLHTECRVCKKAYMTKWQQNKRAEQEVDAKRDKHMYTIKDLTTEEKQQKMHEAYAYIHYQAFGKPLPAWKLKEIEGIEE
jgi:hypothetical protein